MIIKKNLELYIILFFTIHLIWSYIYYYAAILKQITFNYKKFSYLIYPFNIYIFTSFYSFYTSKDMQCIARAIARTIHILISYKEIIPIIRLHL